MCSPPGVRTGAANLLLIVDYDPPGDTGYGRDIAPRFAEIAHPLTAATNDDAPAIYDHLGHLKIAWKSLMDA